MHIPLPANLQRVPCWHISSARLAELFKHPSKQEKRSPERSQLDNARPHMDKNMWSESHTGRRTIPRFPAEQWFEVFKAQTGQWYDSNLTRSGSEEPTLMGRCHQGSEASHHLSWLVLLHFVKVEHTTLLHLSFNYFIHSLRFKKRFPLTL